MQIISQDPSTMPDSVKDNYQNFMKALLFLCQKSIDIREKREQGQDESNQNKDECEESDCEEMDGQYYHDDIVGDFEDVDESEEEWQLEDEDNEARELYDSNIDNLDEVIVLRDQFN